MKLYDNAYSPFARKVRIALELKGIEAEIVDGLDVRNRELLRAVNGRVEVPALEDGPIVVVGSSDILAYLERVQPAPALYPTDPHEFARARAWERCADTYVDAIITAVSIWSWAERDDTMPEGMKKRAQQDLEQVYLSLNAELAGRSFVCGELSVVECALYPHLTGARSLGVSFDAQRHPNVLAWFKRLRALEPFERDVERARAFLAHVVRTRAAHVERHRIFWRNDRIEWVLSRGFHDWFFKEIEEDRVAWPGPAVPTPRA